MKMKALHLISGGDAGGAKTHIYALMKGFEDLLEARTICFIKDKFYEDAKSLGIDIDVLEQKSRFDMSVMKDVAEIVNNGNYDIIHCHGARANFNTMFLKKHVNVPIVTTIHSDYKLDFKDSFVKNMVFTPLNTYALKRFNNFIAITENFKEMLIDRGFKEEEIYVVYNGIDIEKEEKYVSKEEFLKRYNIPDTGNLFFGIAARLDLVKDHKTLLNALGLIKDKLKDTQFLIAGSGNSMEELKNLSNKLGLSKNVHFLGQVSDPFSLFNALDVNILTSTSESFPYAILEGAKMKCPIISTEVGGIPELVEDGINGYLFKVGDSERLSQLILQLIDNPDKISEMGNNLYKKVSEEFTTLAMAKRHYEIYTQILNKNLEVSKWK